MYFKKSKTLLKFRDVSLKKGLMFFKQDVAKLFQINLLRKCSIRILDKSRRFYYH